MEETLQQGSPLQSAPILGGQDELLSNEQSESTEQPMAAAVELATDLTELANIVRRRKLGRFAGGVIALLMSLGALVLTAMNEYYSTLSAALENNARLEGRVAAVEKALQDGTKDHQQAITAVEQAIEKARGDSKKRFLQRFDEDCVERHGTLHWDERMMRAKCIAGTSVVLQRDW